MDGWAAAMARLQRSSTLAGRWTFAELALTVAMIASAMTLPSLPRVEPG